MLTVEGLGEIGRCLREELHGKGNIMSLLYCECRKTFNPDAPRVDEEATRLMVREIMEECDVDHDGKISFDEFVPWYTRETEYIMSHSERVRA